jgi:hypothetical protein
MGKHYALRDTGRSDSEPAFIVVAPGGSIAHSGRIHYLAISIQKTEPSSFERDVTPHGVRVVTVLISQPLSTTR